MTSERAHFQIPMIKKAVEGLVNEVNEPIWRYFLFMTTL